MLTPIPRNMNLIIMGNNQVAFDAVCCTIIGVDPLSVDHIRLAHERGFGPVALEQIQIRATSRSTRRRRARRASRSASDASRSTSRARTSPPTRARRPKDATEDYCWGGCPGAIEEAIEILRLFDKQVRHEDAAHARRVRHVRRPDRRRPGEKVVFIGDCVEWEGELGGKLVQIRNKYVDRKELDPAQGRAQGRVRRACSG